MEQLTIGCDLGDRWTQICVLAGGGEIVKEARVRTTPAGFRRYFSERPTARAVIEVGTHSPWVADLLSRTGCLSEFVGRSPPACMPDSSERPKTPYAYDPEHERHHLNGNKNEKQSPADGRGARECFFRAESDPPESEGGADCARQVEEHSAPTLRTQICAVAHLESRLDAEEEEMGVPDAHEISHGDLDGRLKRDRENDRGDDDQASVCSTQTQLKEPYASSYANRLKCQSGPERESRRMSPLM